MGKRVKKKARAVSKEKRVAKSAPTSQKPASVDGDIGVENVDPVVGTIKERRVCPHFNKGVDLVKVSAKLESSRPSKCEDCREESFDRRASKAKGKQAKNKGGGSVDSNTGGKAIWVCLECGHFTCGGIGFPTTPQSHAVRHARQNRHHLAIQFKNPHLRWCFPCSTLIPIETSEENGESKDVLFDIVKLMKALPSEGASVDVEDVWFGSGSVLSENKTQNTAIMNVDAGCGYKVRGLTNLGNTCFFNSVLQNLLASHELRDHFLKLEESIGPLTSSLKKLFVETNSASGSRNVISPKALFGCVCAKAPQFRGFQQHDSHELLRCLLDGLCTEELSAIKKSKSSKEDVESQNVVPTFVDVIFGGMLCSTVSCLKCSHSSIVHEPFLDLSLPIPSKRPLSKKAKPVAQPKKPKLPPKRSQSIRSKVKRSADLAHSQSDSLNNDREHVNPSSVISTSENMGQTVGNENASLSENLSAQQELLDDLSCNDVVEKTEPAAEDTSWLDYLDDLSCNDVVEKTEPAAEDTSWLDYIEPDPVLSDCDWGAQANSDSNWAAQANSDSAIKDACQNIVLSQNALESSRQDPSQHSEEQVGPFSDNPTSMEYHEPDSLSIEPDIDSQSNDISASQDFVTKDATLNGEYLTHGSKLSNLYLPNGSSCKTDFGENSWEDEPLLQVQSSEVLLLPYKEEAFEETSNREAGVTLSPVGFEQDSMDFSGFGDLFNEPEESEGPLIGPPNRYEVVGAGVSVGNSSGSDPDEIDDTDTPISVESCVSQFTKPEILSKDEHAWHCENCSKILLEERRLKKAKKSASNVSLNGGEDVVQNPLSGTRKDLPLPIDSINLSNGNNKGDIPYTERLASSNGSINGYLNCTTESNQKAEELAVDVQLEEESCKMDDAFQKLTVSGANLKDSCNNESGVAGSYYNNAQHSGPNISLEERESGSEDEEENSDSIKVKRDATKRILIDKAPPILTIHLKRFSQDARGRLSKLQGHVDFSFMIDLRPYMHPRCTEKSCVYRLLGVVEHSGTMRGGHYVAYVRGVKNNVETKKDNSSDYVWYHASDAYVREVSFEEVLRCDAYILFYEEI